LCKKNNETTNNDRINQSFLSFGMETEMEMEIQIEIEIEMEMVTQKFET